jgi:hypothetical protein
MKINFGVKVNSTCLHPVGRTSGTVTVKKVNLQQHHYQNSLKIRVKLLFNSFKAFGTP